jgi:DNA helicase MCM9
MFREKVTVQDAVVAVSLVESSMQSSALIKGIDALHTSFPNNPMEEYRVQGETVHNCYSCTSRSGISNP